MESVIIAVGRLILILIESSSTTRVEGNYSGGIVPTVSCRKLCSCSVGLLICVVYVPSSFISVFCNGLVGLSRSVIGSSTPIIIFRERHEVFSHRSILHSFEFFIPNFFPTPAWSVSLGAAVNACKNFVSFCRPFWLGSGCRELSSALTLCSCSSERRLFNFCLKFFIQCKISLNSSASPRAQCSTSILCRNLFRPSENCVMNCSRVAAHVIAFLLSVSNHSAASLRSKEEKNQPNHQDPHVRLREHSCSSLF